MRQARSGLVSGGWLQPSAVASLVAAGLCIAGLSPASAQTQDKAAIRAEAARLDAARQLEQRKERLGEAERRALSLQSEVRLNKEEQAQINERLLETGRLVQQTEGRLTQLEGRLAELDIQERRIRGSLELQHGKIVKLFSAMQRMGRNPPPVIVTRREDALEMVRSAMLLARAFPELKTQADALAAQLNDLVTVTTAIRTDSERLKTENTTLNEARRELAIRMESRRKSLGDQQRELEEVRRAAAEMSKSVTDLGELIARLDKTVAEHTTLGAYNRQQAQIAAASPEPAVPPPAAAAAVPAPPTVATPQAAAVPQPPPVAAVPPAAPPNAPGPAQPMRPSVAEPAPAAGPKLALGGPRPQGPAIALEPRGSQTVNHTRMTPAVPFIQAKGQLPLPAQGRKLIAFGDKTQFGSTSKGIVLETRAGATITSPCDGWVVYAGEFRSYGQVLIVNAGGGYHVLLANLSRIDVEVGRFVLGSEPVGTMSSNLKGKGQDSAPVLYVEFRNKEGHSIDPEPWWAEGSQKVQG